jgi:hypothetical protein
MSRALPTIYQGGFTMSSEMQQEMRRLAASTTKAMEEQKNALPPLAYQAALIALVTMYKKEGKSCAQHS